MISSERVESSKDAGRRSVLHRSEPCDSVITLPARGGSEGEEVRIGLVDSDGQVDVASKLLNRMYSWRGMHAGHQLKSGPTHTIFTASANDEVIGTITLAVDSPAGLAIDKTHPEKVERFRRKPGARLCELTKLAFDINASSKPVLASLFHVILIYGSSKYGCTDLFIEVAGRHVRFYESMLGFERVGEREWHENTGCFSQLMWLKVDKIRGMIAAHRPEQSAKPGNSLYPFFLSQHEQRHVYDRLWERHARIMQIDASAHPHLAPQANSDHADPRFPTWMSASPVGVSGHGRQPLNS